MADVRWIKLATNIFDNRKIRQIECLPDGDGIIVVWFKLLCLAGNINDDGMVYFTKELPYNDQMLSIQFNRPVSLIQLSLQTFQSFGMIDIVDDVLHISNWQKYQNTDKLHEMREYNRLAQQRSRARKKELQASNDNVNDMSMTCQPCQGTDKEEDIEEDKDIDIDKSKNRIDYQLIADMYNETCVSFPRLTVLSDKRKQAIKARSKTYTQEQFQELFTKAEASDFLKGGNDRNWTANFDWLMKDANFAKVLDGNYDNRQKTRTNNKNNGEGETYGEHRRKAEEAAINEWGNVGTYL